MDELDLRLAKLEQRWDSQVSDEALRQRIFEDVSFEEREARETAWQNRISRRMAEIAVLGKISIPLGIWDADLDAFHSFEAYAVDLEKGYVGTIQRHPATWTWCGYIQLPRDHPCVGKSTEFFGFERPVHLPPPPQEITWSQDGVVGFDHCHQQDSRPYNPLAMYLGSPSGEYVTHTAAQKEVHELCRYLCRLARWMS